MKKLIAIALLTASLLMTAQAVWTPLIQYASSTNSTWYLNGTNYTVGYFPPYSTNQFNLYSGNGNQANTNFLPSVAFNPGGGYPGTLYGPYNNTVFYYNFPLAGGTNATAGTVAVIYAAVGDDGNVVSNYLSDTFSPAANATNCTVTLTNKVTGAVPTLCVQEVDVRMATGITNAHASTTGKPGL